jgi:hypothetical protein
MNIDRLFRCSIDDDLAVFDNLEHITIESVNSTNGGQIDFAAVGGAKSVTTVATQHICKALFRGAYHRNTGSVRNLRDREMAVQLDFFNKADAVCEIDRTTLGALVLKVGDVVIRRETNQRYKIIATDHVTLRTRIRAALSIFTK